MADIVLRMTDADIYAAIRMWATAQGFEAADSPVTIQCVTDGTRREYSASVLVAMPAPALEGGDT